MSPSLPTQRRLPPQQPTSLSVPPLPGAPPNTHCPRGLPPSEQGHTYGDHAYWEERYQQEPGSFDWYQGYASLRPLLKKHIPRDARILQVGGGK